jgi:hypothetical protein
LAASSLSVPGAQKLYNLLRISEYCDAAAPFGETSCNSECGDAHPLKPLANIMKTFSLLVASLLLLNSAQLIGQAPDKTDTQPSKGKFTTYLSPFFLPSNLEELARNAQFIIEGKVSMALPSRHSDPSNPYAGPGDTETDYEVTITRILKGPRNAGIDKAIVSQTGGRIGEVENEVAGDPPMQVGEVYVLFLVYDDRPNLLKYKNTRWTTLGVWQGKFKVENGTIQVSPKSRFNQASSDLSHPSVAGMKLDDFLKDLEKVVTH